MTPADPTLNALLVATAAEDWPAWYGCTRLALADYLEDRDAPGDRLAAGLVRQALPTAWAQCPVRPGWEVDEVRLCRGRTPRRPSGGFVRVAVDGWGLGDDSWSSLTATDEHLWPAAGTTICNARCLREFPLRALRLSAVILDESEVSARVVLRGTQHFTPSQRPYDLKLTPRDARLWCRREVLGLFKDVTVRAPCSHCHGKGTITPTGILLHAAAGLKPGTAVGNPGGPLCCPVCRSRPPRPCAAPSLLPTLPAVARPALAPVN